MKKLLVSDYDGTFYTDKTNIRKNVIKVNEFRAKGNLFIIATGRSYHDFKDEITKYHIPCDYIILNQGSIILDKNKKIFNVNTINKKIIPLINNYLRSYQDDIKEIIFYSTWKNNVSINCKNITKIGIELDNFDQALELENQLNKQFKENINAFAIKGMRHILVEIVPLGINKSEAIKKIVLQEAIKKENVYTIGNGTNDLEMLQEYNGRGMTNSEELVIDKIPNLYEHVYQLIDELN